MKKPEFVFILYELLLLHKNKQKELSQFNLCCWGKSSRTGSCSVKPLVKDLLSVSVHVFPVSYGWNSTQLNIPFNQIHTCISQQWASSSNLRRLLLLINQRQKARLFLTGRPRGTSPCVDRSRRTRPPPSFPTEPSPPLICPRLDNYLCCYATDGGKEISVAWQTEPSTRYCW